ncbi:MAG: exodeoxyribonuclease VII large subunit [Mariprofundales bacterium]
MKRSDSMDGDGVLTVSALTDRIKQLLEQQFQGIHLTGEVSRFTRHASGHLYFTIKDSNASISAVVWRSAASRLRCQPHEGGQFLFVGHLSLYPPRGSYQLVVRSVAPAGEGALAAEYERRKRALAASGCFDAARKRPLPSLPQHIGIVTSTTAAALEDVRKVLATRPAWLRLTLAPALVQGAGAPASIVRGLTRIAEVKPDLILLVRGGGSMEDLWCFNDPQVVEAILQAPVPVITGIGHEIDTTLADLAADLRAATPSNAAECCCPDRLSIATRVATPVVLGRLLASRLALLHRTLMPFYRELHHLSTGLTDARHQQLVRLSALSGEWAQGAWRRRQRAWLDGNRRLQKTDPRLHLRLRRQRLQHVQAQLRQCRQLWSQQFQRGVGRAALRLQGGKPSLMVRQQVWRGSVRELREQLLAQHQQRRQHWLAADQTLRAIDPHRVLARGFVMVHGSDGHVLTSARQLEADMELALRFSDGTARARVEQVTA